MAATRTKSIQKVLEQTTQIKPDFESKIVMFLQSTSINLKKLLAARTYEDPTNSVDKDCYMFFEMFATHISEWNGKSETMSQVIQNIEKDESLQYHNKKCFEQKTVPEFAKYAKNLLYEIDKMAASVKQEDNVSSELKKILKKYSFFIMSTIIGCVMCMGFAYYIAELFRTVDTTPMLNEIYTKQKQIKEDKFFRLYDQYAIMHPILGGGAIKTMGGQATTMDEMKIFTGVSLIMNQFVTVQHNTTMLTMANDRCFEVSWITSDTIMDQVKFMLLENAKKFDKDIDNLPSPMLDGSPENNNKVIEMTRMVQSLKKISTVHSQTDTEHKTADKMIPDEPENRVAQITTFSPHQTMGNLAILETSFLNDLNNIIDRAWNEGNIETLKDFQKKWIAFMKAFDRDYNKLWFLGAREPTFDQNKDLCKLMNLQNEGEIRGFIREMQIAGRDQEFPQSAAVLKEEDALEQFKQKAHLFMFFKNVIQMT